MHKNIFPTLYYSEKKFENRTCIYRDKTDTVLSTRGESLSFFYHKKIITEKTPMAKIKKNEILPEGPTVFYDVSCDYSEPHGVLDLARGTLMGYAYSLKSSNKKRDYVSA